MTRMRIVVIGGASQMFEAALVALLQSDTPLNFLLTDYNKQALDAVKARHEASSPIETQQLNLFESEALRQAIHGADLVIHAAGPFFKTVAPVIQSCLAERVNYLDFSDDAESVLVSYDHDADARKMGISVCIGCGAAPGLTNVMAREVAAALDTVHGIETAWVVGEEGKKELGRAVIEHMIHCISGDCWSWEEGQPVKIPAFSRGITLPFTDPLAAYQVFQLGHSEPLTLFRSYPDLQYARCYGALYPPVLNGIFRGIAQAVEQGHMTMEQAIDFLNALAIGKNGAWQGWRAALRGIWQQVVTRETSLGGTGHILWKMARGKRIPPMGGLYVRANGMLEGKPRSAITKTTQSGPGTLWESMDRATGLPIATFVMMLLEEGTGSSGVLAPEAWVEPARFYATMGRFGLMRHLLLTPVTLSEQDPSGQWQEGNDRKKEHSTKRRKHDAHG